MALPQVSTEGAGGGGADFPSSVMLYAGLLGAVTVLLFAGRALGAGARAARIAAAEVERQLRGFPLAGRFHEVPAPFTPTYRLAVDLAGKGAFDRLLGTVLLFTVGPLLLGFGLRVLYSSREQAIQGLAAFVAIAAATGLSLALTIDATRAILNAAHRSNGPRGATSGFESSEEGAALGDLLGIMITPAALLVTKVVATASLVVVPLLH
jgi:Na+/H+-translocating membrane pyrophosphatase